MFLLSTDYVNNQNIIITYCDKKPRGKAGGSAISVYQALLHPPIESLGMRLKPHPLLCPMVVQFHPNPFFFQCMHGPGRGGGGGGGGGED